jgi:hypothetical protein
MQERWLEARKKWPRENDPERNPAWLCDTHGRPDAPICGAPSMRIDLWEELILIRNFPAKEKECLFPQKRGKPS